MNHNSKMKCKYCNTELTDDIYFTDEFCFPCYEEQLNEFVQVRCELCGNIWEGGPEQCNCWEFYEFYNVVDDVNVNENVNENVNYDIDYYSYFDLTSVADIHILDSILLTPSNLDL